MKWWKIKQRFVYEKIELANLCARENYFITINNFSFIFSLCTFLSVWYPSTHWVKDNPVRMSLSTRRSTRSLLRLNYADMAKQEREKSWECHNHKRQPFPDIKKKKKKKKGKRKVQGVPQSQTAALPRLQEEEETDKSKSEAFLGTGRDCGTPWTFLLPFLNFQLQDIKKKFCTHF